MYLKPFPDTTISSQYGFRSLAGGTFHEGVDYRVGMRTPLPALADGAVVAVGETKKYGKYVVVKADRGDYFRWHACDSVPVKQGARVKAGQTIALSGRSGFWSTGPHAHLQCTKTINPNSHVNPLSVLGGMQPAPGNSSGDSSTPFEEDDMFTDADRALLKLTANKASNAYEGVFNGAEVVVNGKVQKYTAGVLPIVVETQKRLAVQAGQIAALSAAVSNISGGTPINLTAIEEAAEKGAREAFDGITFKAQA